MSSPALLSAAEPTLQAPQQLLLPDIFPTWEPVDSLFFALLPTPTAAENLGQLAADLRTRNKLRGRPLPTGRLQVSLHNLGVHYGLKPDLVKLAREAAQTVEVAPFSVEFDHALSFTRHANTRAFVLRQSGTLAALHTFHRTLGDALRHVGLGRYVALSFTPHVTLLYDRQSIAEHTVKSVGWTANEFVLIHSLAGQTEHVVLGRWPLRG